jgi:hypothetical protein
LAHPLASLCLGHEPKARVATKKLIHKKLLIFKRFQDVKKMKCFFPWWQMHESIFATIGFFVQ